MVEKAYKWADGARLEDHTRRKHKILREYFFRYIITRCQIPKQQRFRLAVVDGFAGGGRYECGAAGSPIIFVEELERALSAINLQRANQGLGALEIECLLVLNDAEPGVSAFLRQQCEPVIAAAKTNCPKLRLQVAYMTQTFEAAYPAIRDLISTGRFRNVLYNLDQCGHSRVERSTLVDILSSTPSAEVFYTFSIKSLLAFLHRSDPARLEAQLRPMGVSAAELAKVDVPISNSAWLGFAERLVFNAFLGCAPFVSPFSIHNPDGWRYWLIHFANAPRARQVYNDVLHANSNDQAHFGRSGLNMLSYDPSHEGRLYLFDAPGREAAKTELLGDIPRLLSETGKATTVGDFYQAIYNATAAHSDDIHAAMVESDDLDVFTPAGGLRRKANQVSTTDTLRLKPQRSFFPRF